jgi:hypothetical protein
LTRGPKASVTEERQPGPSTKQKAGAKQRASSDRNTREKKIGQKPSDKGTQGKHHRAAAETEQVEAKAGKESAE